MQSGQEAELSMHARRACFAAVVTGAVMLVGCTGGSGSSGTSGPSDTSGSGATSRSGGTSGSGGGSSGGSSGAALATLTVHIGLFGGPMRPSGGMALSNSPAENADVTAVNSAGRKSAARTHADGVATMKLAPGRYAVYSTYCGTGHHHVVLTADKVTRVQIDCAIP